MSGLLFTPLAVGGLTLKNRITMAPLYLGYPDQEGYVTPLVLEHYQRMAASGAALIVVENAGVDLDGVGSPRTMLAHEERFLPGLESLARTIKDEGALAFLQLNHAGRFACAPERIAPSPFETWGVTPRAMDARDLARVRERFVQSAVNAQRAGFDGVELHGGTGYLLVQFLSPRTNQRLDEYGGSLQNRMRFPLEVVDAVLQAVGDFPVGYRLLVEEFLPDEGLQAYESLAYAGELAARGVCYLSATMGTYDSFTLPRYQRLEKKQGFMALQSGLVKRALPQVPVITAGRIQSPERAEALLTDGDADLIGLARVLLADPLWPRKAQGLVNDSIVDCEPTCSLCLNRVMAKKPALCSRWGQEAIREFRARLGEAPEAPAPAPDAP